MIAASTRHRIAILLTAMLCVILGQAPADPHRVGQALGQGAFAGNALPQLSAIRPDATLADAFDLQKRFVDKVAKKHKGIAGYKERSRGGRTKGAQAQRPALSSTVPRRLAEATAKPTIRLAKFPGTKIETEIGFIIGSPSPADHDVDTRAQVEGSSR